MSNKQFFHFLLMSLKAPISSFNTNVRPNVANGGSMIVKFSVIPNPTSQPTKSTSSFPITSKVATFLKSNKIRDVFFQLLNYTVCIYSIFHNTLSLQL